MSELHLLPKHSYHICGDHCKQYALWLLGQLPDAYEYIIGSDDLFDMAVNRYPSKNYIPVGTTSQTDKHKLLVMNHVSVDNTALFHSMVKEGDVLYTLQDDGYYDYIEGIDTIDTEDEPLHNMHISGGDARGYLSSIALDYSDVASFFFYGRDYTRCGNGDKYVHVFPVDNLDEVAKYRTDFHSDVVWTYSNDILIAPGPNVQLHQSHATRYSEGDVK